MSRINILTKEVYNKIAAGEVVEKPASVVKELVENSIDAGSTNITIEILEGGIKQIKVSDNGCGIEYDDFDKVFLAHATSKVKDIDDLSKIGTLGFRGEALSSIASVSNITLSSKTEKSNEGYQVKVSGGEMGDITPIGATTGTYIIVSDLFFNIPARKKFLRKPKLEENDITNYIARLILANPNISIKYVADNKVIYHSFGSGLYDAIYTIYGKSIVDNIFEVSFDRGNYKFSGYLGKPTFSKPNRTYQTLIINGRYVINQTIATAINRAFDNFMMKGSFPFFVLNLELPLDKVDVNVHPNKLEVKFEESNSIFGMVYSEVLNILYNLVTTKKISSEDDEVVNKNNLVELNNIGSQYNNDSTTNSDNEEIKEVSLDNKVEYEVNKIDRELNDFRENIKNTEGFNLVNFVTSETFNFKVAQNKSSNANNLMETSDNYQQQSYSNEYKDVEIEKTPTYNSNNTTQEMLFDTPEYKVVGTLFDTYILIEQNNSLLVIDQHAGHERLLFDKFNEELNSKSVAIQPLIVPYILETNYNESAFISENIELISQLGFEIEEFGDNSFKVSSVPLLFENFDLEKFFSNLLSDIDNKLIISKNSTIKEYLGKKACRSAVKGNDKLTKNEINELIKQINQPNQVLLCPHGRPIVLDIDKKEIEKWFKRIV